MTEKQSNPTTDSDNQEQQSSESRATPSRSAIYLLPNLFTTAAMFSGFYAIISAINDKPVAACIAIFIASLLDAMDGRVARMTHTQSDFGVQYDSLSDLISFGLAPSILVYTWSLSSLSELGNVAGKLGWLVSFLFAACAALRLARFNTQAGKVDKSYFIGLSSPAAAGIILTLVWCAESFEIAGADIHWLVLLVTLAGGLLMVSNVKYFSFKRWPEKVSFFWILLLVIIFALLALDPPKLLFAVAYGYTLSGPFLWLRNRLKRRSSLRSDD